MTRIERPAPPVAAQTSRPPIAAVLGLYAVITVVLTGVATIAARYATTKPNFPTLTGPAWLDAWYAFDSDWYYQIATNGYSFVPGQQSSVAFFPTYPMTVRAVGRVLGDYQVAGQLISVLAGVAAVVLFTRWVWQRLPRPSALTAIGALMLYPFAFFLYGPMYGDSLFLLVGLSSFLLLERRQYWLAGAVGALATAGRPNGIAVAVGLVIGMLEMLALRAGSGTAPSDAGRPWPIRPRFVELVHAVPSIRWREAGVFVSGLGLIGWCVYLWYRFSDPLLFLEVQATWDQGAGPSTWFKIKYFDIFLAGGYRWGLLLTVQAVAVVIGLLLLGRVKRYFGWGYAAYALVVLAIPLIGTGDFLGTGRYVMVAFPVMAAGGHLLATLRWPWVRWVFLACCAIGIMVSTALYAVGELIT
jgi:hypothetical protein